MKNHEITENESTVSMENFYNLRFGHCKNDAQGDFVDNIIGKYNIYVATGLSDHNNNYLLVLQKGKFHSFQGETLHDRIDQLSKGLADMLPLEVAKALLQSGYDRDMDGIIDFAPAYEQSYFEAREDDEVAEFSPCFFVLSSVTYDCSAKVNLSDGSVHYAGGVVSDFSDFYGCVNEDDTYVLGVSDLSFI